MRAQSTVIATLLLAATALISTPLIAQAPAGCSMYANDAEGADLGAKINTVITQNHGNCQIMIRVGTYDVTTPVTISTQTVSILGAGSPLTVINYKGTGDFIRWQMNPWSIQFAGTISGLTINGTNAATSGIHLGDIDGAKIDDVIIAGFTSGSGLWQDNRARWTERYSYTRVKLSNNLYDWRISVNGGRGSHGYGNVQLILDVRAGQTGVQTDSDAYLYHSNIRIQGNASDQITAWIKIEPHARWNLNSYSIFGEGTTATNGIVVADGGSFNGVGYRNLSHMTDISKAGSGILETGLGGTVTTSGKSVGPGSCQRETPIDVSQATASSTVMWAFSGTPPESWLRGIFVMPSVSLSRVTIYLCNSTSSSIAPAPATLNIRVVN